MLRTKGHAYFKPGFVDSVYVVTKVDLLLIIVLLYFYVPCTECTTGTKVFDYNGRLNLRAQTTYSTAIAVSKTDCCRACNEDDLCASVNYKLVLSFFSL